MYTFLNVEVNIVFEDDQMSLVTKTEFTDTKILLEAIQQRRSIRNYSDKPIPPEIMEKIDEYLSSNEMMSGPFGNNFKIVALYKKMGDAPGWLH